MLKEFLAKYERLIVFLVMGSGVTIFYSVMTAGLILSGLVQDNTVASLIATFFTIPMSFVVHKNTTYRDIQYDRSQMYRFGVNALVIAIAVNGSMKASDLLGWPFWLGLMISWVVIPILNFAVNSIFVFRTQHMFRFKRPGDGG
jgi:putative flippase GtrA